MSGAARDDVPDAAAVWEALRRVQDPEVGEDIVELGLVYRVDCGPQGIEVDITMTSSACPLGEAIASEAEREIRAACPQAGRVAVRIVFEPPWTPERMSAAARERYGWR